MLLLVRSSEVHVDLELHLVARVAAIEDRRASLAVGERVAGREIEPVLELDVDSVDRHLAPGEEDAGGLEVGDDPREVEDRREREGVKLLIDAGAAGVQVVEVPVTRRQAQPFLELVVPENVEAIPAAILETREPRHRSPDVAAAHVVLATVDELS